MFRMPDSYYDPPEQKPGKSGDMSRTISLPVPSVGDSPDEIEYEAEITFDEGSFWSCRLTTEYRPIERPGHTGNHVDIIDCDIVIDRIPARLREQLEDDYAEMVAEEAYDGPDNERDID